MNFIFFFIFNRFVFLSEDHAEVFFFILILRDLKKELFVCVCV